MNRNTDDQGNSAFLGLALVIIIFAMIPAWYAARAETINGALLALAKFELRGFLPFSAEARTAWDHIAGLDPALLTWERMQAVLSYTGKWIRWPFGLFLVLCGLASIFMGRVSGLTRRLGMESLLKNNAESFACLHPIVGRGKELLDPRSYDAGNWRIARSPLQCAVEHGLLLDEKGEAYPADQVMRRGLGYVESPAYGHARLDEDRTLAMLRAQLGPVFGGFDALSPGRKALAVAFLAYADGDKKDCLGILNDVARAYTEQDGKPGCALLEQATFAKRLKTMWEKHQEITTERIIARHTAFELTWFMALLTRARKKGVLASSQFLWLRPLDRPLWYALHQCGGRAAWAEGIAAWAQYAAEEKAGKALSEPRLAQAVTALREALSAQGWFMDKPVAVPSTPVAASPVLNPVLAPKPDDDVVLAPAEDMEDEGPDYDVYRDQLVMNEKF
jgi:hypothetical protein